MTAIDFRSQNLARMRIAYDAITLELVRLRVAGYLDADGAARLDVARRHLRTQFYQLQARPGAAISLLTPERDPRILTLLEIEQ